MYERLQYYYFRGIPTILSTQSMTSCFVDYSNFGEFIVQQGQFSIRPSHVIILSSAYISGYLVMTLGIHGLI